MSFVSYQALNLANQIQLRETTENVCVGIR